MSDIDITFESKDCIPGHQLQPLIHNTFLIEASNFKITTVKKNATFKRSEREPMHDMNCTRGVQSKVTISNLVEWTDCKLLPSVFNSLIVLSGYHKCI